MFFCDGREMLNPPVKLVDFLLFHCIRGSLCTFKDNPDLFMHKTDE